MIPTNKFEPKHLRIKGTRCARKSNQNSSKGHKNHKRYKKKINATMKASIDSEDRFSKNGEENLNLWRKEMGSSPEG
jgi:hypothetical protein